MSASGKKTPRFHFPGILVAGVDRTGSAAEADLRRGMLITSIDGQGTPNTLSAAKVLYAKGKGETVRLDVIWPQQRGALIGYRQFTLAVKLR